METDAMAGAIPAEESVNATNIYTSKLIAVICSQARGEQVLLQQKVERMASWVHLQGTRGEVQTQKFTRALGGVKDASDDESE
jgi:hypothetical protein